MGWLYEVEEVEAHLMLFGSLADEDADEDTGDSAAMREACASSVLSAQGSFIDFIARRQSGTEAGSQRDSINILSAQPPFTQGQVKASLEQVRARGPDLSGEAASAMRERNGRRVTDWLSAAEAGCA